MTGIGDGAHTVGSGAARSYHTQVRIGVSITMAAMAACPVPNLAGEAAIAFRGSWQSLRRKGQAMPRIRYVAKPCTGIAVRAKTASGFVLPDRCLTGAHVDINIDINTENALIPGSW